MLKGLLKMAMLNIISENNATGYQIMKKVTELTREKPSTGSIYPLLKSMQNKGWITGTTQSGKTTYKITTSGKKVMQAHDSMKKYYEQKISGSISLINSTFDNKSLVLANSSSLINPISNQVQSLLEHGITPEKITPVLSKALKTLQTLMED
jgi:DNA-binding PadR family transcriptional regulator